MEESSSVIHVTVRRSSRAGRLRLWAELDGDFGVVLAQSNTLSGLRRNAVRALRREWKLGHLSEAHGRHGAAPIPEIQWHKSTRRYARLAGPELTELRRRMRESTRTARRIERGLRRAGAYAREARYIARGQVYVEIDLKRLRRTGRFEVPPWSP